MSDHEPADHEDEQHRQFRAALERKKAQHSEKHAAGTRNKGVPETHNDKQRQEFRRKSG